LTVIGFRKYRATRGGKGDIECRATQDRKVDREPAPTVRYQPDPKLFVQEGSDGYEPLSPFQSTVAMVASSNTKSKSLSAASPVSRMQASRDTTVWLHPPLYWWPQPGCSLSLVIFFYAR